MTKPPQSRVILAMINNIVLDGFKHFDKTKKGNQEQQKQNIITLPSFVSTCSAPHSECTGQYTDTFHMFRLVCNCPCGHKSQLTEEKKNQRSGSSSSKEAISIHE